MKKSVTIHRLEGMILFGVLLVTSLFIVSAFETNSSSNTFEFTITAGKNNNINSTSYENYVVLGGITGSTNSTNYVNEIGFLITNPFLNGEACQINAECVSGTCCGNNTCQPSCTNTSSGGGGGSSGGGSSGGSSGGGSSGGGSSGGGGGGGTTSNTTSTPAGGSEVSQHFITPVKAGEQYSLRIRGTTLAIYNVTFITKENLDFANIIISLEGDVATKTSTESYQYAKITSSELSEEVIDTFTIQFKIPISAGFDPDITILKRYDGTKWVTLKTRYTGSDSTYYYFESETDEVGLFAITRTHDIPTTTEKAPLEEVTGEVVNEQPAPQVPRPTPPSSGSESEGESRGEGGSLWKWLLSLLMLIFLVVIVLGLYAYRVAENTEERRMNYLEFQALVKDIHKHLNNNDLPVAVQLYKKLMPHYVYLIQQHEVSPNAKLRIYTEFKSAYMQLNKQVKQTHMRVPKSYWKAK